MELPIFYMPINIGLAKKFIWVFLWDGMEKPEWTFWSTQYKNPCHFPNLSWVVTGEIVGTDWFICVFMLDLM